METSIIVSGFGGQGTLFAGQVLAYAALDAGKNVTWIPSYGPEMRGGTAHCTVIVSDEEIGSPIVRKPTIAIALNLPSLDKYENKILSGGLLIANTSLINRKVERKDITTLHIPVNNIAEKIGNVRLANMVAVGAMVTARPILSLEEIESALEEHLPERHKKLIPANFEALRQGAALASKLLTDVPA